MKTPPKHHTHWIVLYANGNKAYFACEESAREEAVLYGIGLTAPIYRSRFNCLSTILRFNHARTLQTRPNTLPRA